MYVGAVKGLYILVSVVCGSKMSYLGRMGGRLASRRAMGNNQYWHSLLQPFFWWNIKILAYFLHWIVLVIQDCSKPPCHTRFPIITGESSGGKVGILWKTYVLHLRVSILLPLNASDILATASIKIFLRCDKATYILATKIYFFDIFLPLSLNR